MAAKAYSFRIDSGDFDTLRAAIASNDTSADQLRATFLRLVDSSSQLASAVRKSEDAARTAVEAQRSLGSASGSAAGNVESASSRMSAAATRAGAAVKAANDNVERSYSGMGQKVQQISYQINDFAVQVASGQSAVTAFIQQGSQVLGAFGPIGGIAAVALAVGGIALKLLEGKDASKELTEALKEQKEILDAATQAGATYRAGLDAEAKQLAELTAYYNTLSEAQRQSELRRLEASRNRLLTDQSDLAKQASNATSPAFAGTYVDGSGQIISPNATAQIQQALQALKELRDNGNGSAESLAQLSNKLNEIASKSSGSFQSSLQDAVKAVDGMVQKARELDGALRSNQIQTDAVSGSANSLAAAYANVANAARAAANPIGAMGSTLANTQARLDALRRGGLSAYQRETNQQTDASYVTQLTGQAADAYRKQLTTANPGLSAADVEKQVRATDADRLAEALKIAAARRDELDTVQKLNDQLKQSRASDRGASAALRAEQADNAAYSGVYQQDSQTGLLFDNATEMRVAQALQKRLGAQNKRGDKLDTGQQATIQSLQTEISMIGMSAEARNKELAVIKAEAEAKQKALNPEQTAQYVEQAKVIADLTTEVNNQKAAYSELGNFVDSSFNTIGNAITTAFVQGKDGAISFGSVVKSVISEITQEIIKLSLLNPLKNALGLNSSGTAAPTLSSVGGLIGKLFSGGSSSTIASSSMSAEASLATTGLYHSGGVIGAEPSMTRVVSARIWDGAKRFHSGGLVGGEEPIIAQRGEVMFTAGQTKALGANLRSSQQASAPPPVSYSSNFTIDARNSTPDSVALLKAQLPGLIKTVTADQARRGGVYAQTMRGRK